ncbi:MAG: SPOR domain-containing protein [Gammaproteobacteria bacterium]|nr:SPOR domain-containing protein [Gammaproteobacteria bacterium]
METNLKQRLIGAVVIIALAVIFVPMLFDGSGRKESSMVEAELSLAPPKFNFESQLPDAEQLDSLPAAEKDPVPQAVTADPVSEPTAVSAPADKPDKVEKPVVQESKPEPEPEPKPEPVKPTASQIESVPSLGAWAVQVAAFEEKSTALALQKKLTDGKFSSFTEKLEKGGKVLYRVKAGPELKRENAHQLRAKIEKELGIKGAFVTPHP